MTDIDLKPCPFCGGDAEIVHINDGENEGGSCVQCSRCLASSNVEFEFKENFIDNWNRRTEADTISALRAEVDQQMEDCTKAEEERDALRAELERKDTALRDEGQYGYRRRCQPRDI